MKFLLEWSLLLSYLKLIGIRDARFVQKVKQKHVNYFSLLIFHLCFAGTLSAATHDETDDIEAVFGSHSESAITSFFGLSLDAFDRGIANSKGLGEERARDLEQVQKEIGYEFKDRSLLVDALTHSSVSHPGNRFERLEFLGDRVLGLVIAEFLYKEFQKETEGALTKRLDGLVCEDTCNKVGNLISLPSFLRVAKKSAKSSSILADAVEALIGAVYLDGGMGPCQQFIIRYWEPLARENSAPPEDAKSTLQKLFQSHGFPHPTYTGIELPSERGGTPRWEVKVFVGDRELHSSIGSSKSLAGQAAAGELLKKISKRDYTKEGVHAK